MSRALSERCCRLFSREVDWGKFNLVRFLSLFIWMPAISQVLNQGQHGSDPLFHALHGYAGTKGLAVFADESLIHSKFVGHFATLAQVKTLDRLDLYRRSTTVR